MDTDRVVRAGGTVLAAGAVTWGVTMVVTGPPAGVVTPRLEVLGGLAYQVGLAGFLVAAWLTGALGRTRGARVVLGGEAVLLALASVWSVVYALDHRLQEQLWMVVLDVTWPLSMVGLIPVGAYIWRARVWRGRTRRLPLVASLWLPLGALALLLGDVASLAFNATWMTVVWGGLGLLIATRHGVAAGPSQRVSGASTSVAARR